MANDVEFLSGRKGSNPGGRCNVLIGGPSFQAYVKYCYGPSTIGKSVFRGPHQPVYEAITFEMANWLGLRGPRTGVIFNRDKNVHFHAWKDCNEKDPSGREFYFFSEIIDSPADKEIDSDKVASEIISAQRPYLESLLIEDVVGKRQNYFVCGSGESKFVSYLDFGCSFVHAKEGFVSHPARPKFQTEKEIRRARSKLSRYHLFGADGLKVIDLADLPEFIRTMKINLLNPNCRAEIKYLISQNEIDSIENHFISGFSNELKVFEREGLVVRKPD